MADERPPNPGFLIDGLTEQNERFIVEGIDRRLRPKARRACARARANRLRAIFPAEFPRPMFGPISGWASDEIARLALESSSHPEVRELSVDEKITWSRLAVHSAFVAGLDAQSKARGEAERAAWMRYGDPVFDFESACKWADLPNVVAPETPNDFFRRGVVLDMAERLGVTLEWTGKDSARLAEAIAGVGSHKAHGLPEFIKHLGLWWCRNVGRMPEKSRGVSGRSRPGSVSFLDYVKAALQDCAPSADLDVESAVRRTLEGVTTKLWQNLPTN